MANEENIRPYANLVHDAAQGGGPDQYLKDIADTNFDLGVKTEKDTEILKCILAALGGIAVYKAGKWINKKIEVARRKKEEAMAAELAERIDEIIATIKNDEKLAEDATESTNKE